MTPRTRHLTFISVTGAILVFLVLVFAVKLYPTFIGRIDSSKKPSLKTARTAKETKVKVSYIKKEDRNIATQVYLIVPKRIVKKVSPVKEVNDTHIDEARSIKWVVSEQEMEL